MKGYISSFQSMGTVDGPGLRYVIFMQGCPLRCSYCHNPETWKIGEGPNYTVEEVINKLKKYKSFFGKEGGLTVSGGEALVQLEFVLEIFKACKKEGISTCLDTSGMYKMSGQSVDSINKLLDYTGTILLDIKFNNNKDYLLHTGGNINEPFEFLDLVEQKQINTWIRQVIVPKINDSDGDILELNKLLKGYKCIKKIELLPFKKLCTSKYENLNIKFRLLETEETKVEKIIELNKLLNIN